MGYRDHQDIADEQGYDRAMGECVERIDALNGEIAGLVAHIHDLETAIRAITYEDNGAIRNALQHHVDLGDKQPILRKVWENFGK